MVYIRINKAKGMQKPSPEMGDFLADINLAIFEDVALIVLYVDDRLPHGEFTSEIVVEETCFTC